MELDFRHSVLQQIIRNRLDTALEDTLRKDWRYQDSKQKAKEKAGRLSEDMFTPEQWDLIDDALEESNASGSEYRRFLHTKTGYVTKEKISPAEKSMLKNTEFYGRYLFWRSGLKNGIIRQPLV